MPRFKKKPITIEAHQWFKNGDHPQDECEIVYPDHTSTIMPNPFLSEGKVVRCFRHPDVLGADFCSKCNKMFHNHGWIDVPENGHNVCPGDWIITGVEGEHYPIKPSILAKSYDEVKE